MHTDAETDGPEMWPMRTVHTLAPTTLSKPESGSKEGDSKEPEFSSSYVLT